MDRGFRFRRVLLKRHAIRTDWNVWQPLPQLRDFDAYIAFSSWRSLFYIVFIRPIDFVWPLRTGRYSNAELVSYHIPLFPCSVRSGGVRSSRGLPLRPFWRAYGPADLQHDSECSRRDDLGKIGGKR